MIKSFEEYIKTSSNISRPLTNRDFCDKFYLESMKEYFGDDIPNGVYEAMQSGDYTDFILENLKSHDINLLCRKIKEKFGKNDPTLDFVDVNDKGSSFGMLSQTKFDDDELKNLLDYFGYYITDCGKDDNRYNYSISPIYASDANDLVYVKNHGKLYHFCTGENANEIEKTGLRSKSGECGCLPERIYAYASCKNLNKIPDIYDKITKLVDSVEAEKYGIYIYRIDLNKSKNGTYINFYNDDIVHDKDVVYTYNNIPAECMRLVDVLYTDEMLLKMASISQNATGLDVVVWVQTNNAQSIGKHNLPQIKFQNNTSTKVQLNELIPISISDNPEILLENNDLNKIKISQAQINEIKQWIVKNKEILIDYWKEKITTDELFQKLKK